MRAGISKRISTIALCAAAAGAALPRSAQANVGQDYGFGSESAATGGVGTAWGYNAFASYYNPAALAADNRKFRLTFGLLGMQPVLKPISGVVIENEYTSDKERTGEVGTDYRMTFGQLIGASVRLLEAMSLSAGATVFLPINSVAYLDTGEAYVPEYVLYRSRTQRPQVNLGLGARIAPRIHVGAGAYLGFALSANATVFLQTDSAKPSTMRFATSMKPKLAPYVGLYFGGAPGTAPVSAAPSLESGAKDSAAAAAGASGTESGDAAAGGSSPGWSAGLVVRAPLKSANNMVLNSGARAFGSFAALDFAFKATSALYYDPLTVEAGFSTPLFDRHRVSLQAEFQRWSAFEAPTLAIQEPVTCNDDDPDDPSDSTDCGVTVSPSYNPNFDFRDIIVPRVGYEYTLSSRTSLRGGYAFRPSIMKSVPNGAGNFLDPTKHIITAGVGLNYSRMLGYELPWRLDIHGAWQRMNTQTIVKTAGDETGASGKNKIGAPGYQAGGNVFGGGVSVSFVF